MKVLLYSYLFVAAGGALGATARFTLNVLLQRDVNYPWGTLAANLLGCFALGIVAHLVATSAWFNSAGIVPDQYRLLFAVGFCGSFTTLSTLVLELHTLMEQGAWLPALSYLVASVVGGYLLFFAALVMMRSAIAAS
jgi:CrcB protein